VLLLPMSPAAILVLSLLAFLSAPAAFVLLWILNRQAGDRAVRELAYVILGNAFILLGNLLTAVAEGSAIPLPYGVYVLLLDEVTVATIMTGAFLCSFAHTATQTSVTPARRVIFWSLAFVLHTIVLSAALLPNAGVGEADVTNAFVVTTLGGLIMQSYATALIVAGRRRIPTNFFVPHLSGYFLLLLPLGLLAAANDVFRFGSRLGGDAIPFSPFFSVLINGFITVIISRRLAAGRQPSPVRSASSEDIGLTLRESEILPLLLEGATNEQIGERLHISPHTVKNHVTVIFRKTGAESRFDLLKAFK
jgi:DNA-binding CsgD family transcriptional regulator